MCCLVLWILHSQAMSVGTVSSGREGYMMEHARCGERLVLVDDEMIFGSRIQGVWSV